MNYEGLVDRVKQAKGKKDYLQKELEKVDKKIDALNDELQIIELAVELVRAEAKRIQKNVSVKLSSVVDYSLTQIFSHPYSLDIEFQDKYGKVMVKLGLRRGDNIFDPLSSVGGGVVDIASLALRLAFWSLIKSHPVIIADEPLRYLSESARERAGMFLKEIGRKLGVQLIITSHAREIISYADKVLSVEKKKHSIVKEG